MNTLITNLRAFLSGIPDGWHQPHYLSTSTNIDHLPRNEASIYNWQDRGINIGQILRAGTKSEAWRLNYWPLPGKAKDK